MSQKQSPPTNVSMQPFLLQTVVTVALTLAVIKFSPPGFLQAGGKGAQGPAGTSCQVETVRYDPSGSAVLAFKCGKSVRELTVSRGKQGPPGPAGKGGAAGAKGKDGASCQMTQSKDSAGRATLVFACGSQKSIVPIGEMIAEVHGSRVQAPSKGAPQPAARRPQPRPAARQKTPKARPLARPTPKAAPVAKATQAQPTRGEPSWGRPDAKVKIIEYSDFQCPFCQRGSKIVEQLKALYPESIRVVFKHLPLPFHPDAHLAAQASMAAHAQGKFWKYHDLLFANTTSLKRADLERYAKQVGLDMTRFKKALDSQQYKAVVDANMKEAKAKGASGTPTFFVNGHKIAGALPISYFKKVISAALKGQTPPAFNPSGGGAPTPAPRQPAPNQPKMPQFPVPDYNKVSAGNAPSLGPKNAPIQIVEFSDFECGFCSRAVQIIKQIKSHYGKQVRVAFRHLPLPFHKNAHLASQASMAAHAQGKFWAFHDALFSNQKDIQRPGLERIAKRLGLDMTRFKNALDNQTHAATVNDDLAAAQSLKIRGTPTFFINGYRVAGAFPFFYFQKVIDAVKAGKKPPAFSPPGAPSPNEPEQTKPVSIVTKGSPSWGPKDAPIQIVEFSDFECNFCSRGAKIMKKLKKMYGSKIRLVFKHTPLDNHPNANIAAQASMEAHAQGKFWKYHNLLFANFDKLNKIKILELARKAGVDLGKLAVALEKQTHLAAVARDQNHAQEAGVSSTPTFFINGFRITGARPFHQFKLAIDAALTGRSIPKAIKPHGKKSTRPIKIMTSGAPSFGPKDAKVQIIEFSDFECGFCSGVTDTIKKLKKEYKGKIRFVFKHLPLKFHKKARRAAQAAMAAHEQGKFWAYHDFLFKNQKQLSKALYIKGAQKLGLNMKAFLAVIKSKKYLQQIDADYDEGRWAGADGTPAFIINGKRHMGNIPYNKFKTMIDAILKGQ